MEVKIKMKNSSDMIISDVTIDEVLQLIDNLTVQPKIAEVAAEHKENRIL